MDDFQFNVDNTYVIQIGMDSVKNSFFLTQTTDLNSIYYHLKTINRFVNEITNCDAIDEDGNVITVPPQFITRIDFYNSKFRIGYQNPYSSGLIKAVSIKIELIHMT